MQGRRRAEALRIGVQRRGRAEALRVEMTWRRNDLVKLVRLRRNEVRMARTDGAGETELLGAGRGRQSCG